MPGADAGWNPAEGGNGSIAREIQGKGYWPLNGLAHRAITIQNSRALIGNGDGVGRCTFFTQLQLQYGAFPQETFQVLQKNGTS